jgi:hypothetical protein
MWQLIVAAPILLIAAVVLTPLLLGLWAWRVAESFALRARVKATWPPGKVALIAYTRSPSWAPYIEQRILPLVSSNCIVVDRSQAQWKERFPLERRLISHYGGAREHNPLAIVFSGAKGPQVYRLYSAFRLSQKGRSKQLEDEVERIFEAIREASGAAA